MAVEPALTTSAPIFIAPVTLWPWIPHPVLPDMYDGAHSGRVQFLQSCLTYIHLSRDAFDSNALKIAWVLSYMKTRHASTYVLLLANSLHINVEIEMMDTQQTHRVMALLDSRAMGLFLDSEFVKHHGLTMQPLPKPIPIYNINRTPNKAGTINSVVDLVLCYQNHVEHAVFAITSLGRQDMILGFTWLHEHNSKVNWTKGEDLIAEGIVCVYLDNILIYTKILEEHHQITCLVLEHFCQHQLYLKLEKCKFEQTWIKYLGLNILHEATEMDLVKVAEIHSGLLVPILLFLDDNSPFQVDADTSDFATGAVLLQQSLEDEKWHPVAFYSKSLNMVEQNYKIHDKEMLAIIWSFEEWQHLLEGMQHKFKHKPGWSMGKPDVLSWRVDHGMGKGDNSNIVLLHPELFAIQAMEGLAVEGAEVDILWDIQQGNWDGQQEELVVQAAHMLKLGHSTSAKVVSHR
ncbi:hypothetical protein E4T56_gene3112 [Termitomyces sp. T112]|nr:hypothetical protein E4T56_gene3112 [Termitomyces sp. T112]